MAACALLGLVACGTASDELPIRAPAEQRYEANVVVVGSDQHGPQLCAGPVLTMLPPSCEGPPINNWDWDSVAGERRVGKTIWGDYHVVGTFDGRSFTLTDEPGPPRPSHANRDPIITKCPTPTGGWTGPELGRTGAMPLAAAGAEARKATDFAGFWVHDPNAGPQERYGDLAYVIINAAFTGDLEEHERDLRKHWGGALCVTRHEHTLAELEDIQQELYRDEDLDMLTSSPSEVYNRVDLHVLFVPEGKQAELDRRYGPGVVKLTAALRPVG